MQTIAPLIAACMSRLTAGLVPTDADLSQIEIALEADVPEDDLIAIVQLVADGRGDSRLAELCRRAHGLIEQQPQIRRRCETEVIVPSLRAEHASAPRDQRLVGLYGWTEHAGETSFAMTHTTLLLLRPDGHFARGTGPDGAHSISAEPCATNAGDRGVWMGARGRIIMASDSGRHESFSYVRQARSLNLMDDDGSLHLLQPLVENV